MIFKIRVVTFLLFPNKNASESFVVPPQSTTATLTPLGVVAVFGGSVCVVSTFVLFSFKIKPTSANATASSSNKYAACYNNVANIK